MKSFWTGPPVDTLPRRIKCQLTELLSDAALVFTGMETKISIFYNEYQVYPRVQYVLELHLLYHW
jgi:hypothetical protein